ncbi:uncharacterized protein LOC123559141 [Mercenaria mercenaria]|uniref:uncharacterized protein LOC123559141 n=1 Tax=Mercenaria mercenaria TaxID=6596 RepID=UPI001E1D22A0|nr:uncharacterized protein LOC123559141 [Mercenaria mercenaria]
MLQLRTGMDYLLLTLVLVCTGASASTTISPSITTGATVDRIFNNVDRDMDGIMEKNEFDNVFINADKDKNGCVTLEEYKSFSAGSAEMATRLYKYFDKSNTHCVNATSVSWVFATMDANNNGAVTMAEFQQYFMTLLQSLFHVTTMPVV